MVPSDALLVNQETPRKTTVLKSVYDKQKEEFLLEANYLNNGLNFNLTLSLPGKCSLWDLVISDFYPFPFQRCHGQCYSRWGAFASDESPWPDGPGW